PPATWPSFTPKFAWVPAEELDGISSLVVNVAPGAISGEPLTRAKIQRTTKMAVQIAKTLTSESEGDAGRLLRSVQIDWLIHKARLQVDAVPFAPEVGDRIVSADGNYEVQLLGDDPCFRRATDELYRIHVRKIASA
ncbi:MAG: hypothetical protein ACK557_12940, partial [Planctomycetota bacterium]